MKHSRFFLFVLSLCLTLGLCIPFAPVSHAAAKLTETVNLARPQKNESGSGYYWDNRKDTLTLDGLYIETTSEYGMKIPPDSTVILKGKNYITASRAALAIPGSVTFKGSGSLTLVSDDMGMYFYSTDDSTGARFLDGTYTITAGGDGIRSDYTSISIVEKAKFTISAPDPDHYAIAGCALKLFGSRLSADNAITTTAALEIRAMQLDVTASKPALTCDRKLTLNDVAVSVGSSAASLAKAEEYGGENCVSLKSTASGLGTSALFGDGVPRFVDILVVLLLALLIGAGIGVPFLRSRRKAKAALAAAAQAEAAGKSARSGH